ncbi:DMT family transporter [Paenochrobactrum glaciei]|uniref:DMT family transporter n=1 Tax=Paenochrobactrum glaciei TaxID=486407 RepID=A0ABN1G2C7_9HYPH
MSGSVQKSGNHVKGLLITAIGGLFLTVDIPLIKLADGNAWSVIMVRAGLTFIASLVIWAVWSLLTGKKQTLIPGKTGIIVALLYGLSATCFVTAVFNTSTANLVFILALNPMVSAILGWVFLKERPSRATFITMFFMVIGVLIIVSDGVSSGGWFGDMVALLATTCLASAITISRTTSKEMGLAAIIATCLPCAVALYFVVTKTGYQINDVKWIALDGALILPVAFICLATGPRYLSGPEVAMFYLLETILAPIWVWMIFQEVPSTATLTGGAIMITALLSHSTWQLRKHRARRKAFA